MQHCTGGRLHIKCSLPPKGCHTSTGVTSGHTAARGVVEMTGAVEQMRLRLKKSIL